MLYSEGTHNAQDKLFQSVLSSVYRVIIAELFSAVATEKTVTIYVIGPHNLG